MIEKDIEKNLVPSSSPSLVDNPNNRGIKNRKHWFIHGFVFLFICCLSAGVGIATYFGRRSVELSIFQTQFDSTTQQLQNAIQTGLSQKFAASRLLNKLYAFASYHGYGTTYGQSPPFFTLPGMQNYSMELLTLGSVRGTEWHPLVDNTTRAAWELWAKKNIVTLTAGYSPSVFKTINATAYKYGICNKTSPTTFARVSGTVIGGDPRFKHWLFPIWETAPLPSPGAATIIFLDPHSWAGPRYQTVEKLLAAGYGETGAFSDVVQFGVDGATFRPSTHFYSLVYSISSSPKVIGLTNMPFSWDTVLLNVLPNTLKRVDCVLTTKTSMSTLAVDQGDVIVVGKGDFHEASMTSYGQSIVLDVRGDKVISPLAASGYALTVYPSTAYFNHYITQVPTQLGIAAAFAVFFVFGVLYVIQSYYAKQQERMRGEKERWEKSQEEAHRAQADAKKAEMDREREHRLRAELQDNIANSAHDIKSPTTALGLAVESLLDALDNNKPLTVARRHQVVETLHGMAHTISALTMIINRSVDSSKSSASSGRGGFIPNKVPVELEKVVNEVVAFSKWQADGTGIEVVMEPLPDDLPDEIMMDEKWLRDDCLCVAGNAIKYSRSNQGVPVLFRVAIVPSPSKSFPASVQFSFIDSGYPLSEETLTNLFDRPMHSARMQIGGLGLGLFCLSEHMKALQGQYGARRRQDGREGTEVWFSFPLIEPAEDLDEFKMEGIKDSLDVELPKKAAYNVTGKAAVKPLFSSPQNRRSSLMRSSQKSRNSSATDSSMRDNRGGYGQGIDNSLRGGVDNSLHGGMSSRIAESVASVPIASSETDSALAGGAEHPTLGSVSKEILLDTKNSDNHVQEVLGTSPILLVDDAVSILKMTKRAIQNECDTITFMEAKNGEEAFARVVEAYASFQLIITDIQMPICDGFEFTRRVRQLEREKGLTPKLIIGISANDQQKIAEEAKASGMDGFMHKPFKISTLLHVIEDIKMSRIFEQDKTLATTTVGESNEEVRTNNVEEATPIPMDKFIGRNSIKLLPVHHAQNKVHAAN